MVRVGLTLQLVELSQFKALTKRPLDDTTITRNGNKRFFTFLLLYPLDFPDNIVVLVLDIFTGAYGFGLTSSNTLLYIVNRNVSVGVSNSNHILLTLCISTASDTVVAGNSELGERRIFKGVETKETTLEFVVVNTVDIVFSVTYSNQVLVSHVDIDASDLTALS